MEWRSFSGFACPVLAVLFRLSFFGSLLFFLSCYCCPVLIVMLLLSWSDCHVMTACLDELFRFGLSNSAFRIMAVLSVMFSSCLLYLLWSVLLVVLYCEACPGNLVLDWLPCRGCPVQALISWSSCSGLSLLAVRSWLSCPCWPLLALLFRLSCPACSILPVLVFSRNSIMDVYWNLDVSDIGKKFILISEKMSDSALFIQYRRIRYLAH
jgi:hypothetical protein